MAGPQTRNQINFFLLLKLIERATQNENISPNEGRTKLTNGGQHPFRKHFLAVMTVSSADAFRKFYWLNLFRMVKSRMEIEVLLVRGFFYLASVGKNVTLRHFVMDFMFLAVEKDKK